MKRCILFGCILWSVGISAHTHPHLRISLITQAPGEELYSVYGHSGLRVQRLDADWDYVFHWGLFDFEAPGFYINFLRGFLWYKMGAVPFDLLHESSVRERRSMWESALRLDSAETEQLFQLLQENYRPENRRYLYDFIRDNCATRPRDVLRRVWGQHWVVPDTPQVSYRMLLRRYQSVKPWANLGIDLLLGTAVDRPVEPWHQMFLPMQLKEYLSRSAVDGRPAVVEERALLTFPAPKPSVPPWLRPLVVFILLLVVEVFLMMRHHGETLWLRWYDVLWFVLLAGAGVLIAFMWFGTEHWVTKWNWNLLWLHPLYLVMAYLRWRPCRCIGRVVRIALALMLAAVLVSMPHWGIQSFPLEAYVLMGVTALKLHRLKRYGSASPLPSSSASSQ